jgi:hypothetical protein
MNNSPTQRSIIFGASLATALVVIILVFTAGRKPAPAPISAPVGEAALPMLDGVNKSVQAPETTKTSDAADKTTDETSPKAEPKPVSKAPLNH